MSAATMDSNVIRVFATGKARHEWESKDISPLGVAELRAELIGVRCLRVASAFYDINFLLNWLNPKSAPAGWAKHLSDVKLLFNRLGGERLLQQHTELRKLSTKLEQRLGCSVEVRLASAPALFHPKLILVKRARWTAFVGSANATTAAMDRNEEVLVSLHGQVSPLVRYFDGFWEHAADLTDVKFVPHDLIAFFRSGRLFFKPTTPLVTTFHPFQGVLASLKPGDRRKLNPRRNIPFAEDEHGIGPFDLKRVINYRARERMPRLSLRRYAIETCYGFWVPQAVSSQVDAALKRASLKKRQYLDDLRVRLKRLPKKELLAAYQKYLRAVENAFHEAGVRWEGNLRSGAADPRDSEGRMPLVVKRLEKQLSDLSPGGFMERYSQPLVSGSMPELWQDEYAYGEFKDSFFAYLAYVSTRPTAQLMVPGRLLKRIRRSEHATAEEIETALVEFLTRRGWRDSYWTSR